MLMLDGNVIDVIPRDIIEPPPFVSTIQNTQKSTQSPPKFSPLKSPHIPERSPPTPPNNFLAQQESPDEIESGSPTVNSFESNVSEIRSRIDVPKVRQRTEGYFGSGIETESPGSREDLGAKGASLKVSFSTHMARRQNTVLG